MALIKSISGIRGTIGGYPGENLTPIDVVKFSGAYAEWLKESSYKTDNLKVIVGRDARISGKIVEGIVISTLQSLGINVINIGLSSTPTVEHAVVNEKASGGIIITASHNPRNWNALKLLNNRGEFLNDVDGKLVLELAKKQDVDFANVDNLGSLNVMNDYDDIHIDRILKLELVNLLKIKAKKFKVAIDCINSVGGIVIPKLLKRLGIDDIIELYCTPDGNFGHNPEPLPENLTEISKLMKEKSADVGFVVDPDVDRLAIVCEDGSMFGEEYTLVAVADYILSKTPGNTVSNLSSTRALRDITEKYGYNYFSSAVGEVNVVAKMKETNAVIGGEGNGGVIYPTSHYGRDALVGIALFLSLLAEKDIKVSELKKTYPEYYISKNKIQLNESINVDNILIEMTGKYKDYPTQTIDGLKVDFPESKEWFQLRKSNTEPIIRIYAESANKESAEKLANQVIDEIKSLI